MFYLRSLFIIVLKSISLLFIGSNLARKTERLNRLRRVVVQIIMFLVDLIKLYSQQIFVETFFKFKNSLD